MTAEHEPVVSLKGVRKDYRGLRPLRIEQLELKEGRSLALLGFDQVTAEVLVNLITGATVPDAGEVRVLGQSTAAIPDADAWLRALDEFGIISDRAVLLDRFTVEQNLVMPFSLDLDEVHGALRSRVHELAHEVGIDAVELPKLAGELSAPARLRLRLGRALALNPRLLLAEHPSASLPATEIPAFAADFSRILAKRRIASLIITADSTFAAAVAEQVVTFHPATGQLRAYPGWRRWFA